MKKKNTDQQMMGWIATILGIIVIVAAYTAGFNVAKLSMTDGGQKAVGNAQALNGAPLQGDPNAPVLMEEWSDFECPFCARFYSQTLPQIEEQYIKTGKVKLVYKNFPLSFHATAQKAAEAGKCAFEQGKFWELHNKIFDSNVAGVKATVDNLKAWARELGMDGAKFDDCLDSGRTAAAVQAELQEGQQQGIRGTPGFLINGQLVSGAQPFTAFQQVIEAKLAG